MIIDEIALSGGAAYLRAAQDRVTILPGETATSRPVGLGEAVEVDGIDLLLSVDDARSLFRRHDTPLFTVELRKELFPNLYLDPYEHRIVQLSGFEDLRRQARTDMILMEIDGIATLVSPGDRIRCGWQSARYPLPAVSEVDVVAWDLAASTLTPADNFSYTVVFHTWAPGQEDLPEGAQQTHVLTDGAGHSPQAPRHRVLANPLRIVGYRFEFTAAVQHDAALAERHGRIEPDRSLGTPLLQALYVLERTPRAHAFHSLQEVIAAASSYQMLDPQPPLSLVTVSLQLQATLTQGEAILLHLPQGEVKWIEARLNATDRRRPVPPVVV